MGRLAPISVRELIRKLREFGWEGPYHKGKHPHMVQNGRRLKIPNPHGADISGDLLKDILRNAGITADEWNAQ